MLLSPAFAKTCGICNDVLRCLCGAIGVWQIRKALSLLWEGPASHQHNEGSGKCDRGVLSFHVKFSGGRAFTGAGPVKGQGSLSTSLPRPLLPTHEPLIGGVFLVTRTPLSELLSRPRPSRQLFATGRLTLLSNLDATARAAHCNPIPHEISVNWLGHSCCIQCRDRSAVGSAGPGHRGRLQFPTHGNQDRRIRTSSRLVQRRPLPRSASTDTGLPVLVPHLDNFTERSAFAHALFLFKR